jgi:hypothetical protein
VFVGKGEKAGRGRQVESTVTTDKLRARGKENEAPASERKGVLVEERKETVALIF